MCKKKKKKKNKDWKRDQFNQIEATDFLDKLWCWLIGKFNKKKEKVKFINRVDEVLATMGLKIGRFKCSFHKKLEK